MRSDEICYGKKGKEGERRKERAAQKRAPNPEIAM